MTSYYEECERTFREVLEEACEPVEDGMGEEGRRQCQDLMMKLGQGDMDSKELEQKVKNRFGEKVLSNIQDALTVV